MSVEVLIKLSLVSQFPLCVCDTMIMCHLDIVVRTHHYYNTIRLSAVVLILVLMFECSGFVVFFGSYSL